MKKKIFVEKKEWWKSKTVWTNVLILLGGFCTALSGHIEAGGVISLASLANIALRVVTKSEIMK